LKFVPTPKSINIVEIIANTETFLRNVTIPVKQATVAEITKFTNKWKKPKTNNMNKEENIALKEIKAMHDIIIVQADKGGKIVVLDKEEYITKIEEKLNDKNLYEQVKDPTNMIKQKLLKMTNKLFDKQKISLRTKYELTSIEDLSKIRGQPKLHKINHPMRIITSGRYTITAKISKLAFSMIKQLRETIDNTMSNTRSFIQKISQVTLEKDEYLASLDVEDLFSNIPITRAVDIAINRIEISEKFKESSFTKTDIKQILLLALNNTYSEFNGKYYKQKRGLPMGNSLSPILADLYMHDYMNKHMNLVNKPNKLWRYVDDILIITKMTENELKEHVNQLNKIRSNIRFTYEYEKDRKINFLDTTITRNIDHNNIDIRWFRKETASDRL
jgi:hypothetical protein